MSVQEFNQIPDAPLVISDPMLAQHRHSLIMFQRLAIGSGYRWKQFVNMVDQVLPKNDANMLLPFIGPSAIEP